MRSNGNKTHVVLTLTECFDKKIMPEVPELLCVRTWNEPKKKTKYDEQKKT